MKFTKKNKIAAKSVSFARHIIPSDTPLKMHIRMTNMIYGAGYRLCIKKRSAVKASLTTTDPVTKTLWLAYGWDDRSVSSQAVTLAHEFVHIMQFKKLGVRKFATKYATPRGRWILEMQAYRVSILAHKSLGNDVADMPRIIGATMWKNYKPWLLLPKSEIIGATIDVLSEVAQ